MCNKIREAGAQQHGQELLECIDYFFLNRIHLPITLEEVGRERKRFHFGINMQRGAWEKQIPCIQTRCPVWTRALPALLLMNVGKSEISLESPLTVVSGGQEQLLEGTGPLERVLVGGRWVVVGFGP